VYGANFARDRDIADPNVLRECLEGLVVDPAATLASASEDAVKVRLRENTDRAGMKWSGAGGRSA
jgi:2-hydroxychromene-2-carboxylate isomerase